MDNTVYEALQLAFGDEKKFKDRVYILGLHDDCAVSVNTPLTRNLFRVLNKKKLKSDVNYYISANTLYSHTKKRCEKNIFGLKNIVIDVDFHGDPEADLHVESFCGIIYDELAERNIPLPNIEHKTGRGVHLWWCLTEESRELLFLYKIVAAKICTEMNAILDDYTITFDGATVDACASGTAAGVYRLFGTKNIETGTDTECHIIHNNRYSLNELKSALGIVYKPVGQKRTQIYKEGIHEKRAAVIKDLIINRNLPINQELRDMHLFHFYNEAIRFMDIEEAQSAVFSLNSCFSRPLRENQLISMMSSVDRKDGYRYKNSTIIEHLGISEEEQKKYNFFPGAGNGKNFCRNERTKKKKNDRDAYIRKVYTEGHTQAQTAEICGCCIKTVRKVIKGILSAEKDYTESIMKRCKKIVKKVRKASFCLPCKKIDQYQTSFFYKINGHFLKAIYYMADFCHAVKKHYLRISPVPPPIFVGDTFSLDLYFLTPNLS